MIHGRTVSGQVIRFYTVFLIVAVRPVYSEDPVEEGRAARWSSTSVNGINTTRLLSPFIAGGRGTLPDLGDWRIISHEGRKEGWQAGPVSVT